MNAEDLRAGTAKLNGSPPAPAEPAPAPPRGATHAVLNQPPPLEDVNLFSSHRVLVEGLRREGAAWAEEEVRAFSELSETIAFGFQANASPPVLRTHDRTGRRIDEVDFHPAWHALLRLGVEHGLHSLPWSRPHRGRPGAQVARAAKFLMLAQVEAGVGCPLSMTYSAVPALAAEPELAAEWVPRLTAAAYDPRLVPAGEKASALCGMAMTEKQGGSVEPQARRLIEGLATPLQASLLVRHSPAAVADAFCAGRLGERGLAFCTLPAGIDLAEIQERHAPRANARAYAG